MASYFIWNGHDSRAMGVILRGPAPIIRPEERVKHIEIPGRSGDLTEIEGNHIYNSYIQTLTISVVGKENVREISRWLRGDGYVTFSTQPDLRQKARIIGAVTLSRVSRNIDHWAGEVQFYCQPLKEKLRTPAPVIVGISPYRFCSYGDVETRPVMQVRCTGSGFALKILGDGLPDDNTIHVQSLGSSGRVVWIDCDAMEVWATNDSEQIAWEDDQGIIHIDNIEKTELITNHSFGRFPLVAPGWNQIVGSDWDWVQIDKGERYL